MYEDELLQVKKFTHELTGVSVEKLKERTCLGYNLGVDGEDAQFFMKEFGERFGVDMTTFRLEDFFDHEGSYGVVSFIIFIPIALATGFMEKYVGVFPLFSWIAIFCIYLVFGRVWKKRKEENMEAKGVKLSKEVTIGELAASVKNKKWTKIY